MSSRRALLRTTMLNGIAGAVLLSAPAYAQQPAVDGVNSKVEGFGGIVANRTVAGAAGSLTFPLSNPYGIQVDGVAGGFDGRAFGGVAGHLFWRDPGRGLIGLYGSFTSWDQFGGVNVGHFAGEGEMYWGRWALKGIVGVEFGNSGSVSAGTLVTPGGAPGGPPGQIISLVNAFNIPTRFFDEINLKYYVTDNWSAYVGHRFLGGLNAAAFGSEYAIPLGRGRMGSAFVEARVGESSFHGIWGGLKVYFGQSDKPLMARERQSDPSLWEADTVFTAANATRGALQPSSTTSFCNSGRFTSPGVC